MTQDWLKGPTHRNQVLPSNPHGAKLAQIFHYGWSWLEAPLNGYELDTAWKTNTKYRIKPRLLWTKWRDANTVIGVRFGSSTSYAMLDIDKKSPYLDQVDNIKGALETIGVVRTIPIRSSWSGGLHLYIPLPKEFPTFSVACALQQVLEAHGYNLAPGALEVFPNVKTYAKFWEKQFTEYNGHRLPLQSGTGSCLLDDDLEPIPGGYDLAMFLARWDNAAQLNDEDQLSEAFAIARANRRHRRRKATGPAEDWKRDLLAIIAEGWTGPGQTNLLLKDIGTYGRVFEGLEGHALADYIERTAQNCPGFYQFCQHQHDLHRRAAEWAVSVSHFYWPLGSTPLRDRTRAGVNKSRAEEARDRIAAAVRELGERIGLTVSQLVEHLTKAAQTSAQTLYKNADLWHPERSQPAMPVMDAIPRVPETQEEVTAAILASLESADIASITRNGGENEACNLETVPLKNSPPQGKEGGCGGKEGISTAPFRHWPPMDWQPGAVGDCHA